MKVTKLNFYAYYAVCPQYRKKFEDFSLSRSTVAHRIVISKYLTSQLKDIVPLFEIYSIALDESTDIDDTAQLLIFVEAYQKILKLPKNCCLWNP